MPTIATPRPGPAELLASIPLVFSQLGMAISLATLLFTGALADGLPRATASAIIGAGLVAALIGWRSRFDVVVAGAQDVPVVVLLAVSAPIVADAGDDAVATFVVLLALVALTIGATMVLASRFRIGTLVRFLPMTVIRAFIAGTGWLLFVGGLQVALDGPAPLSELADPGRWLRWLPAFALGALIAWLSATDRVPRWTVGASIIATVVVFHVWLTVAGNRTEVEDGGWLVGPFPPGGRIQLVTPSEIAAVPWSGLWVHTGALVALVGVTVLGTLLNVSAMDLREGGRVSIDDELRVAGVSNMLVAPFAGLVGYHLLGDTTLARGMGVRNRTVPVLVGVVVMLAGVWGGHLAGHLPRFVAGGMLVSLGLSLLVPWLTDLRGAADLPERLLGVAIVVSMGSIGVLEAVTLGVVGACAIFVTRYSRIDPIRLASDGSMVTSAVDRPPADQRHLDDTAPSRLALELQGYLFFGSISRFADGLRHRLAAAESPITSLVIDVRHVTGIDETGLEVLEGLAAEIRADGVDVVWSAVDGLEGRNPVPFPQTLAPDDDRFDDLDLAIEAVENRELASVAPDEPTLGDPAVVAALSEELCDELTTAHFAPGATVIAHGEPSDSLHIVASGWLSVSVDDGTGGRRRLRRFGPGGFVGEIGFHTGAPRSADVIADGEVETLVLDRATWLRLRTERPELALELSDRIVTATADRLASLSSRHTRALR